MRHGLTNGNRKRTMTERWLNGKRDTVSEKRKQRIMETLKDVLFITIVLATFAGLFLHWLFYGYIYIV